MKLTPSRLTNSLVEVTYIPFFVVAAISNTCVEKCGVNLVISHRFSHTKEKDFHLSLICNQQVFNQENFQETMNTTFNISVGVSQYVPSHDMAIKVTKKQFQKTIPKFHTKFTIERNNPMERNQHIFRLMICLVGVTYTTLLLWLPLLQKK